MSTKLIEKLPKYTVYNLRKVDSEFILSPITSSRNLSDLVQQIRDERLDMRKLFIQENEEVPEPYLIWTTFHYEP